MPAPELSGDQRDHLVSGFDDDGRYTMHVNAPAHHGAIIDQAVREARDALFNAGQPDVTWLDALTEVCNRSLGTIPHHDATASGSTSTSTPTAPAAPPTPGSTADRNSPTRLLDVLCCDGIIQPLWHTGGIPINVGRSRYIVPRTPAAWSSTAIAPAVTPAATPPPTSKSTTSSNGSATA